jgi:hypothetical protein
MSAVRTNLPKGAVRVVASHPQLWRATWTQTRALTPLRWWSRRPYLPVPDARYWRFRLETAYGGMGDQEPSSHDLHDVLAWAQAMRRFEH